MTLPRGWRAAHISELADLKLGKMLDQFKNKGELRPYLRNINVRWGHFDLSDLAQMRVTDEEAEQLSVCDGDLFICEGGEPGRAAVWRSGTSNLVFQKALHRVRPHALIDADFVAAYLKFSARQGLLADFLTGTTIKHLPQDALSRIALPLAPAEEQRRIVAKLDGLAARIARARAELARVPILIQRMKRQALSTCFSAASDYPLVLLGHVLESVQAGKNLRCEERPPHPGELGVIKVSAVTWGRFDPIKAKTLPPDYIPSEAARIRAGDLLMSRANTIELVGAVAMVERAPRDLFLSDKVLRLVVPEDAKRWVHWFLRSPRGRDQIERMATGNQLSMRNLSQEALRRIELPLPNAPMRLGAIRNLETAFARADRLEAEAARATALLDRLEASILAKAFRGELVPQDSADEPASVLLDRIRAERTAPSKPKRGRRAASSGP